MSGAGKWVKKNPLAAAAILGVATGGIGLLAAPAAGAAAGGLAAAEGGLLAAEAGAGAVGAGTAAAVSPVAAEMMGAPMAGSLFADAAGPAFVDAAAGGIGAHAPMGLLSNAVPEYAALNPQGFNPTAPSWMDKLSAGADKMKPYGDLAKMGMNAMGPQEQPQAPQIAPPQLRGPGQGLSPSPQYGGGSGLYGVDPEEEKRRAYMAYMAQMQGVA
jgi:hypothetical protein